VTIIEDDTVINAKSKNVTVSSSPTTAAAATAGEIFRDYLMIAQSDMQSSDMTSQSRTLAQQLSIMFIPYGCFVDEVLVLTT